MDKFWSWEYSHALPKYNFKVTASTCRFQCGTYYCCDVAITSALRKPRNFPALLFFPKQHPVLLRDTFLRGMFLPL